MGSLTAATVAEVFLALPFSYALHMLRFFGCYFAAASALAANGEVLTGYDIPARAVVLLTQMHQAQLAASPEYRPLLAALKADMRTVLQAQRRTLGSGLRLATSLRSS